MSLTLIGSQRFPFVRICRMFMQKHGIKFDFKVLNFVDDPVAAKELSGESPINRVPILVEDGQKIFDSRVIMNHLIRKHELRPLSLAEENMVSCAYSCMDTGVVLFLMRKDGFDMNHPGSYLKRQRERIPRNLEFMKDWVQTLDPKQADHWSYPAMSIYSFLYWAEARELLRIQEYPEYANFMERFANAEGVKETSF